MSHQYLSLVGLAMTALISGLFGLSSLFRPEATLKFVQIPVPSHPETRKFARLFMGFHGVRNLAISYLLISLWFVGDQRAFGYALLAGLWMSAMDGFITKWYIGNGEWNHWMFVPILAGISATLIGCAN